MAALPAPDSPSAACRVALLPPLPDAHSKRSEFAILTSASAVLALALYGQYQIAANPSTGGRGVVYIELRDRARHHALGCIRADRPATRPDWRATRGRQPSLRHRRWPARRRHRARREHTARNHGFWNATGCGRDGRLCVLDSGRLDGCRVPGRSPGPRFSWRARRRTLDRDHRGVRPDCWTLDRHARGHNLGNTRPRCHQGVPRHAQPRPLRELRHPLRHDYRVRDEREQRHGSPARPYLAPAPQPRIRQAGWSYWQLTFR